MDHKLTPKGPRKVTRKWHLLEGGKLEKALFPLCFCNFLLLERARNLDPETVPKRIRNCVLFGSELRNFVSTTSEFLRYEVVDFASPGKCL